MIDVTFLLQSEDNPSMKPLVDELAKIKDSDTSVSMEKSHFKISDIISDLSGTYMYVHCTMYIYYPYPYYDSPVSGPTMAH